MNFKKYKIIFFDWDGTAVKSRDDEVGTVLPLIIKLLEKNIKLVVISGTNYEKIGPKLIKKIPPQLLKNLYYGVERGATNLTFGKDRRIVKLNCNSPTTEEKSKLDYVAYLVHEMLYKNYNNYKTDIIFSRKNYCKIDLLVELERKDNLMYIHSNEPQAVLTLLKEHSYNKGLSGLIKDTKEIGSQNNIKLEVTSDAKYLEVGFTTKSNNANYFYKLLTEKYNIKGKECCYWGDEFSYVLPEVKGSDAYMLTDITKEGDFFDVSDNHNNMYPEKVNSLKGGVKTFLDFLESQI